MCFFFWNIRGYGHVGRRTQLNEFIRGENIDVVGLQETIKADFSHRDLLAIDPLERFVWHWVPAIGHSGGMLLGISHVCCEVVAWDAGRFFVSAHVRHRASLREWEIIVVYGPADHSHSHEFLGELQEKVAALGVRNLPLIVGGDFNLIR